MVILFFYNILTDIELLKRIDNKFEIKYGFCYIHKYEPENNILEISDDSKNNNILLPGKIVKFNMKLHEVLNKINFIKECRIINKKIKYMVSEINVFSQKNEICSAYIIF